MIYVYKISDLHDDGGLELSKALARQATPWLEDLGSTSPHAQLAELAARSAQRCFSASTDFLRPESVFRSILSRFGADLEPRNLLGQVFVKALKGGAAQNSTQLFHLLVPALCCSFLAPWPWAPKTLWMRRR